MGSDSEDIVEGAAVILCVVGLRHEGVEHGVDAVQHDGDEVWDELLGEA